jgi:threonine synthase
VGRDDHRVQRQGGRLGVGDGGCVVAWRCAVCARTVDVAAAYLFTCPNATETDRHHVLHPLTGGGAPERVDDPNPFVAHGPRLAWRAFARANGMTDNACTALTRDVAGGFAATPFSRSDVLSEHFGAEIWVKDETGNVGGSHKSRHLVGTLLHLRAAEALGLAERSRRPLAIASCGNAAIAAATLARRSDWPLEVFVPDWADEPVLELLGSLGASVTRCARRPSDPPGDPAMWRFREAVREGAMPFGVQGPDNALCLDGGRTIGWEMADTAAGLDRVVIQVGGGALATCAGWGLGAVRVDTVQAEGCAPLARAWQRAADAAVPPDDLGSRWGELMTPWRDPRSEADGILDDETHDWLGVFEVMRRSGGRPLVVGEDLIAEAHTLARRTGIPVSVTGSAGLAGLLTEAGAPAPGERVGVIFSGVAR